MLAQYGGGSSGGGGLSYGPVFWIVVAVVAVAIIGLVTWAIRRMRAKRTTAGEPAQAETDRTDRAA